MKDKKILLINTVILGDNGISTFVIQSAKILSELGNSVTVVATNKVDEKRKNELEENNVKLLDDFNRSNVLRYFQRLLMLIKHEKYDIVHVHGNSNTMAIELVAAQLGGCKVRIAHSHNTTSDHMVVHRLLSPFFKESVTGRFACGKNAGKWLYNNDDFYVVNNGVDFSKYKFDEEKRYLVRRELKINDDDILLGHVGYFNIQKNQEFLVDVLVMLDDRYKIIFLGDGTLRQNVEKIALDRGISDRIIFMGNVANVSQYLNAMDIFVLPSRFEGLPFSLIEAKASGLPCVISDNISEEANLASEISFLSISKPEVWKEKIISITKGISNRNIAAECAKAQLSDNGYDMYKNISDMNAVYDRLIEDSGNMYNRKWGDWV